MTGSQEPRIRIEPERVTTDGADAAELMAAYSCALDPWQRMVLDCWLGRGAAGEYSMATGGLAVPRQNGKNVILRGREFFGMVVCGERILHTAHQVVTAKKHFRELVAMFTDKRHPEITDLVQNIRYTNGEEAIELKTGGSVEFMTRSRQRARGFDGVSVIVLDEAQELTDDQLEAVMATQAASKTGTRQLIMTGTPPYPGCPGTVFRRNRETCRTSPLPGDAWHEWSVAGESVDEISLDDRTLWYMANPSMGIRLTEEYTATERAKMAADGFARERLGWWSPVLTEATVYAIPEAEWDACASKDPKPEGKAAYGVKFSADGAEVVLCGAVIPKEGPARISLIDRRPTGLGTQWLADRLCERYTKASCVVIDGRNGVDVLIEKLAKTWRAKDSVIRATPKTVIAAASTLTNEVAERTLTWYTGQPILRESAVTATKRPIAGGWGFGGDDPGPVEACALALWGARTSKRDPSRRMLIG